jgi:hypothetical protein
MFQPPAWAAPRAEAASPPASPASGAAALAAPAPRAARSASALLPASPLRLAAAASAAAASTSPRDSDAPPAAAAAELKERSASPGVAPHVPPALRCVVVACARARQRHNYCAEHYQVFVAGQPAAPPRDAPRNLAMLQLKAAGSPRGAGSRLSLICGADGGDKAGAGAGAGAGAAVSAQLERELAAAWSEARQVVFKDLPRLARRIAVDVVLLLDEVGERRSTVSVVRPPEDEGKAEDGRWQCVANVVAHVAAHFGEARGGRLRQVLDEAGASLTAATDLEALTQRVLTEHLGLDSRTFAVFRAVHQSILVPAIMHLTTHVFRDLGPLKDVRRPDGWTVAIRLGDAVSVTHRRWEQNLTPPDSAEHFEAQWELHLSFDRRLERLRGVFLRVLQVRCAPNMPEPRRAAIRAQLPDGYVV